jgi:hypothetical protein
MFDFTVEKSGQGIRLLVEAKNVKAPSRDWASQYQRNLFAHGDSPRTDFFLLALRDHLYLWHQPTADVTAPDFETDTAAALRPYLTRFQGSLEKLSQSGFELLIQAWLSDLVDGTLPDSGHRRWAEESGLAASVRNASLRSNIAA